MPRLLREDAGHRHDHVFEPNTAPKGTFTTATGTLADGTDTISDPAQTVITPNGTTTFGGADDAALISIAS
jgi:hypothetical protein